MQSISIYISNINNSTLLYLTFSNLKIVFFGVSDIDILEIFLKLFIHLIFDKLLIQSYFRRFSQKPSLRGHR